MFKLVIREICSAERCLQTITITSFRTIISRNAATNIFIPDRVMAYQVTPQAVLDCGVRCRAFPVVN